MRKFLMLVAMSLVALAAATTALGNHVTCDARYTASHNPWSWVYVGYNYTDWSEGQANAAFDLSRFDGGGFSTWSAHDGSSPYYLFFDNGTYSPWRKTGLYMNGTGSASYVEHGNDNGSCN